MATIEDALLTDIAFTDDLQLTASGDIDIHSGLVNLREALFRRIMTVPGSVLHQPDYGVGLPEFKNAPLTIGVKRQLAKRLNDQLPRDPRVKKLKSVSISGDTTNPETVTISFAVDIIGIDDVSFTYTPFAQVVV
jgi:phage baseplate assembly protein W